MDRRWSNFAVALLAASLVWGIAARSAHAATGSGTSERALQVSFEPAASVRLRGGRFTALAGSDVSAVNRAISGRSVRVARLFRASEADLDAQRRRLIDRGWRDVPDLNRHYRIVAADAGERDRLVAALERLAVVESVIPEPQPTPPPVTADLTGEQRYRTASPAGVDALGLAARAGGRGDRVKIVDIEYDWNRSHEDLAKAAAPGALIANGTPSNGGFGNDHGTAVLGTLIGTANGFGVTGLAPDSQIGLVNAQTTVAWALPDAVNVAHANMSAGDVMLVEQQVDGPVAGDDYVAAEYLPAAYDAIRQATQDGIIVVEAGGNGAANLDAPAYGTPFPSGKADSGAIIAGAGSGDATCSSPGPANARMSFSSYGSRVNLQGWGMCVTTTGYGTHPASGTTADTAYTANFNGTSSAAAIVAGAAALFSSVFEAAAGGRAPTPEAVRNRLIATGTPQAASPAGHIGPLPNLLAAVTNLDTTPPTVAFTAGPTGSTSDSTPAFEFGASEGGVTYRCRFGVTAYAACTSPYTAPQLADGSWSFEVVATDAMGNVGPAATRDFVVDTVAPTLTIAGPGLTNDATPVFTFAASEAPATFECRIDAAAAGACDSAAPLAPQADGGHTLRVRAIDAAGNAGPEVSQLFTVDTVAPTVTISGGPSGTTTESTPSFTFSSSDAAAALACRMQSTAAAGVFQPCGSPYTTAPLGEGAHAFEVQATDAAGNAGPVASRAFSVAGVSTASSEVATPPPPPAIPPLAVVAVVDPPAIGAGARMTVTATRTGWVQLPRPRITCPALAPACEVGATARPLAGGARLGAMTRTIAAGGSAAIRFRLLKSARAKLQRLGRLTATIKIEARHGSALKTRSVRVTIKRAPRG
jgi:hypothetical protein